MNKKKKIPWGPNDDCIIVWACIASSCHLQLFGAVKWAGSAGGWIGWIGDAGGREGRWVGGRWLHSLSVVVVVGDELATLVMWPHALSSCGRVTLSIAYVKPTCNGSVA